MIDNISSNSSLALLQSSQIDSAKAGIALKDAAQTQNIDKITEAAIEFEAVFLTEMMKPMFEGVMKPDSDFGGGKGEEIFKGFMLNEYGKLMAASGGIGIAKAVREELIAIQESQGMGVKIDEKH